MANEAIDLLFPPHCVGCRRFGAWLCADCIGEIEFIRPPVCPWCGLPLATQGGATSSSGNERSQGCCREHPTTHTVDRFLSCAFFGGPLREAIHQFKYEDLRALAAPLGKLMADGWAALSPADGEVDVIVPVPLHPARERQRGYNQSTLLAREMGAHLQRPTAENTLVRARATTPQVDLDIKARRINVHGAFRCVDDKLSGKRVLLVDDVCTTGATLEAASAALRDGGAQSIWAYTLARAKGHDGPASYIFQDKESGKWN